MTKKYKRFDRIFKRNAVELSYEKISLKEFAEELGVLPCLLTRWRKEYQQFGEGSFAGSGYIRVHPDDKHVFKLEKKSKESALRYEILKNASPFLSQCKLSVYQFINDNQDKYSILLMCKVLGIGYGRYHRWKKNGTSEKQQYIVILKEDITRIFFHNKKYFGRNKITKELNDHGYKISYKQVAFYMKQLGLRKAAKRKFKATTDSNHTYYTPANVLNREFTANGPAEVWVSDITYIQTLTGFLYLTIIMDLYDRKIVGWSLGSRLTTQQTAITAFEMAASKRIISNGLIFHSDRGVQYADKAFTALLDSYKCTRSMSSKGDHLDNAVSESFFSSFKRELIYKKEKLLTKKMMKEEICEFIEWYNKERRHSALDYKTIEEFIKINNSVYEKV